jgi:hypothetical protein
MDCSGDEDGDEARTGVVDAETVNVGEGCGVGAVKPLADSNRQSARLRTSRYSFMNTKDPFGLRSRPS